MKERDDDKLEDLFHEIKQVDPSFGFESRLMQQIQQAAGKKVKHNQLMTIIAILSGIVAMIGLPAILFTIVGWSPKIDMQILKNNYNWDFLTFSFSSPTIFLPCIALILLLGDMFVRKHIWDRKHKL